MYPGYQNVPRYYPAYPTDVASSRNIFTLSTFQTSAGTLTSTATSTTAVPAVLAVTGNVEFQQNPFTGDNAAYNIYLNGANMAGKSYQLQLATDCAGTAAQDLGTKITAPIILVNGFYIKGTSTAFNIDGNGTPVSIRGMRLLVKDSLNAIVGCTDAVFA